MASLRRARPALAVAPGRLKVAELRAALAKHGEKTAGLKDALVRRLEACIAALQQEHTKGGIA